MLQLIEDISWLYCQPAVLEMANMQPRETGLSTIVHVMSRGGAKHGSRVKVSNIAGRFAYDDNFTVTAESEPRVIGRCRLKQEHLEDILDWVRLNRDHLHYVWEHGDTMTAVEVSNGFKSL